MSAKSLIKSYEECSKAVICLVWSTVVSRKYNQYELPIQRSLDLMKSQGSCPLHQAKRPYSNGMGRETHIFISREIRMAGLSNRLWYLCNFVGSEVPHYVLMVDEDAHRLIIRLTKAFCTQVDSICCAHRTNVMIFVVCN